MSPCLYSAPEEDYKEHISKCRDKLKIVLPVFEVPIKRIFDNSINEEYIERCFKDMILYHDLGKLTRKWQENVGKGKRLPSHAPIGAGYVFKKFSNNGILEDLKNAITFAIAIHHTDSGLLGDNIERPDVQAILDGIVYNNGDIVWHEETNKLDDYLFPWDAKRLNVSDLKEMARSLRIWARGGSFLEQHKRRLQATIAHHILKLCDVSAASERKEYKRNDEKEKDYYGGWLMVENIKNYVDTLSKRLKR